MNRMSLRAFARWRGVSLAAVQLAITEGRLTSVGRDGRGPFIKDRDEAARQWGEHTRPRVAVKAPGKSVPSALAKATQREREARAQLAELDYARKSRDLVPAREVETRWTTLVVGARTRLLGLPTRAKQRLPHLSGSDLGVLGELVREVLEELAEERTAEVKA
jgi:phage terminase Nu1 subunit (DNA packaging protein)